MNKEVLKFKENETKDFENTLHNIKVAQLACQREIKSIENDKTLEIRDMYKKINVIKSRLHDLDSDFEFFMEWQERAKKETSFSADTYIR